MQDDIKPPSPSTPSSSDEAPVAPVTPVATPEPSTWQPAVSGTAPAYQPVDTSGMVVSTPAPISNMPLPPVAKKSKKKPAIIIGCAIALAVLLSSGFVFGIYLPNTPEGVYSASLKNTGLALDQLVAYTKQQEHAAYKSSSYDGLLTVKSPQGSYDFGLTGATDKDGNADMSAKADVLGEKATVNLRTIHVSSTTNPDIYVQVTGVKQFLDSFGMNQFDSLDGQWISIDHTILDTYSQSLKKPVSSSKINQPDQTVTAPTTAQIIDAETNVQAVNKQYLFSTDAKKAVLSKEKFVGTTKLNGRINNHYLVGYNKDHLESYVTALGDALDSSQLNDWSQKATGKRLSDLMDVKSINKQIDKTKGDYTFGLWTDDATRLISRIELADPSNTSKVFALSQSYTGGDTYPLSIGFNAKDDAGNPQSVAVTMTVNTKTHVVKFDVTGDAKDASGETTVTGDLTVTPSNNPIKVVVPTHAKTIIDVLGSLGLKDSMPLLPDNHVT